ncbi:hypothetical protein [Bartonella schoenbuchensis]|uniref:Uncharacterized protein n=1 Tax=Bartonella schoenbuchensis (strain DSM 13525 / NCTC 13165 / R1) TaxID=687861 RepID=A0A1S6XQP6_BARSR|nr:hypothetical protein [Bartonella schoenbuchensis]AQX30821.1 hypothetical protein BscR1v2_008890 [Bartonella schoenbuchensis R1]
MYVWNGTKTVSLTGTKITGDRSAKSYGVGVQGVTGTVVTLNGGSIDKVQTGVWVYGGEKLEVRGGRLI